MKRVLKLILALAAVLLVIFGLLRWRGLLLFWNEAAPRGYEAFGVDVSNYQGTVDWPALADQGVDFAFLKATEGSSLVDKQFSANWQNARSAGVLAGAYHFFSYDSPGETQADNFIAAVPAATGALPPAVDIEFYGAYLDTPKPPEEVWPILDALLSRLEAHYGQKPVLYVTNESYRLYVAGRYDGYPLWCTFPMLSPVWRDWTFWQYSHHAVLDGYDGAEKYIDLNVFRGSPDDLRAMLSAEPPTAVPPALPENTVQETFRPASYMDEVTVTVTYGDGEPSVVIVTQNGETIQTFVEDGDAERICVLHVMTIEDMNCDGYLDFRFTFATYAGADISEHVYLYDPYDAKGFYKVEELDDYTSLGVDAESRTISSHNRSARMGSETLFKWTEAGLAARRRILWEQDYGGGRTVYEVYDRSPSATPMSEPNEGPEAWTLTAKYETAGQRDPEEEISPWLDPDYWGEDLPTPTEIPQALTDFLLPLVATDTWRPFAQQFAAGKKMPSEEAEKLWDETVGGDGVGSYYFVDGLRVDADNDGVEDIFLSDMQGSGHFNFFYLFSGGKEATDDGLLGNFTGAHFISWQGGRYLLVPSYDYDTRAFDGLDIYLFRDGKLSRRARLEREACAYPATDAWAAGGYEAVLTDLEERAADIWTEFERTWEQPLGTAERAGEEEYEFLCDLDNDGAEERYSKGTASVNVNGRFLSLRIPEDRRTQEATAFLSSELQGNLQLMWVDRWDGENLIYLVDCFGDQPIRFQVYRSRDGEETRVATLTLTPEYGARLAAYETDPDLSW